MDARTLVVSAIVALTATGPGALARQTPPSAFILGQVIDVATGKPVAAAKVTMASSNPGQTLGDVTPSSAAAPRRVLTADDGRFLFRDLAKGVYSMTASAPGFLSGGLGQRRPDGPSRSIVLDDGQRVGDAVIRLWREATLSGVVTDETTHPMPGIHVFLLRRAAVGGRADWTVPAIPPGSSPWTDDRGAYRFLGLSPGEYAISVVTKTTSMPASLIAADAPTLAAFRDSGASPLSMGLAAMSPAVRLGDFFIQTSDQGNLASYNALAGRLPASARGAIKTTAAVVGYGTTFHPAAASLAAADVIALQPGDDRRDVNITLAPVAMSRVSGTVAWTGGALPLMAVHLIPAYAAGTVLERTHEAAVTATVASGAFELPAVPPGSYVLKAWRLPQTALTARELPPDAALWGEIPVTVSGPEISGVTVTLRAGATVAGRVVFDGAPPPASPMTVQSYLANAFASASWPLAFSNRIGVIVQSNGDFTMQGLPPGTYEPKLSSALPFAPRGFFFESATLNGKDLIVSPLLLDTDSVSGLTITFSDKRTTLAGTVASANSQPDAVAIVIAFPADYRTWIQGGLPPLAAREGAVAAGGSFTLEIPPGEYLVAAVNEDVLAKGFDATLIEKLAPLATRVALVRGDAKRQDLKTQVVR